MNTAIDRWRAVSRRLGSPIGFALGVVALAAAVWVVFSNEALLRQAWDSVRDAPPWLLGLAVILPVLDWLVVSLSFYLLTKPYGRVRPGEMAALIGSAWLLNYLPMRAGMVGRVAYHKSVNGVRVVDSIRVMVWGVGLSVASLAVLFGIACLPPMRSFGVVSATLAVLPAAGAIGVGALLGERSRYAFAFACRYVDALCWAARYWVVFAIVGQPISGTESAILAAVTQVVGLLPIAGNGLGIREWAVGLTNGLWGGQTEVGLAADLVSRAGELIVVVPLGLLATAWVARSVAAHRRERRERASEPSRQPGPIGPESGPVDPVAPEPSKSLPASGSSAGPAD